MRETVFCLELIQVVFLHLFLPLKAVRIITVIQLNPSEGEYKSNEVFIFTAGGKTHTT